MSTDYPIASLRSNRCLGRELILIHWANRYLLSLGTQAQHHVRDQEQIDVRLLTISSLSLISLMTSRLNLSLLKANQKDVDETHSSMTCPGDSEEHRMSVLSTVVVDQDAQCDA
jgi:hypothetical protein